MTRRQLLPFIIVAWVGVGTTLLNTSLPLLFEGPAMVWWRDVIMLVHAPATFVPVLGIAILGWREGPFVASAAIAVTLLEKSIEFLGQILRLFPPEESFGGTPVTDVVAAIWDQLFFVLWSCNTVGAACVGFMLLKLIDGKARWVAAGAAWSAATLTLLLVAGPDYLKLLPSVVPAVLFAIVFTGYRLAMAATMQSSARNASSAPLFGSATA